MHTDIVNTEHSEHWLGLDDSDNWQTCGHGGYSEKNLPYFGFGNLATLGGTDISPPPDISPVCGVGRTKAPPPDISGRSLWVVDNALIVTIIILYEHL